MGVITSKFGGFLVYTSKAMYQYWKTNVNTRLLSAIFFAKYKYKFFSRVFLWERGAWYSSMQK